MENKFAIPHHIRETLENVVAELHAKTGVHHEITVRKYDYQTELIIGDFRKINLSMFGNGDDKHSDNNRRKHS